MNLQQNPILSHLNRFETGTPLVSKCHFPCPSAQKVTRFWVLCNYFALFPFINRLPRWEKMHTLAFSPHSHSLTVTDLRNHLRLVTQKSGLHKHDQGDLTQICFVDAVLLQWLNNRADIQNGVVCLFSWRYNPLWLYFSQPGIGL
jgi:hypothetical protein